MDYRDLVLCPACRPDGTKTPPSFPYRCMGCDEMVEDPSVLETERRTEEAEASYRSGSFSNDSAIGQEEKGAEEKRKGVTIESIRAEMTSDPQYAINCMISVYERQTPIEKAEGLSTTENGKGFTKFDSELLSSFSKQYLSKGYLSTKQTAIVQRRMMKYAGQILKRIDEVTKGL